MSGGTWLHARLEFDPCHHNRKCELVLYRKKADADGEFSQELITIELTNEQLTELVVMQKMKPKNLQA